jgi:ABC-2 type transport system permease protein
MFFLLIRVRLACIINVVRDQLRRSAWVAAGLALLGASLFASVLAGFLFLFHLASSLQLLQETGYQVFYFLFLFLLAGSTPFVASTLLHSSDYSLLFSAPIPARSVILAKLVDATVTNSLQFMVLGVPALVACAAALDVDVAGWLLLPILIALFVLIPALLTAFGLLLLLAMVGVARLRSAVTALNAVMAAVACITIVLESPHLPVRPGVDLLASSAGNVARSSPAAHMLPCAWFVDALAAMSNQHGAGSGEAITAVAKILALVVTLSALCLGLGGRLISAANLADESGLGGVSGDSSRSTALVAGPAGALLAKDWRYLKRDSILLSQLGMPLILFTVPFILTVQDPSRKTYGETFYFASAIIGVILFMQTSILSLSSIGLESRAFWIVMTSPIGARALLQSKFLLSTIFSGAVGVTLTLIAAVLFGASVAAALIQAGFVIVSAAALSGLGVGLAAAFPRFVYENPAHRVSTWALILGFFATTGYMMLSGILFAVAWMVATNLPGDNGPGIAYGGATLLYLALSGCAALIPLTLGAHRIESYQWEH